MAKRVPSVRQMGKYPSDVGDEEWAFIVPYLTLNRLDGDHRVYALRLERHERRGHDSEADHVDSLRPEPVGERSVERRRRLAGVTADHDRARAVRPQNARRRPCEPGGELGGQFLVCDATNTIGAESHRDGRLSAW